MASGANFTTAMQIHCPNCDHVINVNPAALMGSKKTRAKSEASRANGKKGGRPRKTPEQWLVVCTAPALTPDLPRLPYLLASDAATVRKTGYNFTADKSAAWIFPNETKALNKARIVNEHMGWAGQGHEYMTAKQI